VEHCTLIVARGDADSRLPHRKERKQR
jgi:hypothetical protein